MKLVNRRLDNFLVSVHPVLRGIFFLYLSYWTAGEIMPHTPDVAHAAWWGLLTGVLFIAGIYHVLWYWGDTIDPQLNDLPV